MCYLARMASRLSAHLALSTSNEELPAYFSDLASRNFDPMLAVVFHLRPDAAAVPTSWSLRRDMDA